MDIACTYNSNDFYIIHNFFFFSLSRLFDIFIDANEVLYRQINVVTDAMHTNKKFKDYDV